MSTKRIFFYGLFLTIFFLCGCKESASKKKGDAGNNQAALLIEFDKYALNDLSLSHDLKEILCQNWDNKEDVADSRGQQDGGLDIVSRGFSFFRDGTMIKNIRGDLREGSWALNETSKPYRIEVKYKSGEKETFQVAMVKPFLLTLNTGHGTEKILEEYSSQGINNKNLQEDPFYMLNNQWRIKPTSAENDAQIKARLRACIHFFVLFYDYSIHSKASTVNFTGFPSCYRWYAGGIFIYKENELSEKWINCFYNKEQAMKAYKMADDVVGKKYTWPKGEKNWLKQNVFVLKQMEQNLQ